MTLHYACPVICPVVEEDIQRQGEVSMEEV